MTDTLQVPPSRWLQHLIDGGQVDAVGESPVSPDAIDRAALYAASRLCMVAQR